MTVPTDYPSLLSIHRPIHVRYIAIHKTLTTFLLHSQEIDRNSDLVRSCLKAVVALVAGRVPLLIEIKDQDGNMGGDVGPLEEAVAAAGGVGE